MLGFPIFKNDIKPPKDHKRPKVATATVYYLCASNLNQYDLVSLYGDGITAMALPKPS